MKNKYLLSLIPVLLGVICLIISASVGSTVKPDGALEEPTFFLIPVSYFFFFSGGISILYVAISSKLKKSK
ncbi:hypothetical protein bcgnr5372_27300 [Bacillus luti]|nr:DUF3955 domain-containing protein [Bacillus cereus]HDR8331182.1 DUF3955 domain-containing protein [Bacillus cereus]HDR8338033.1 DUF3955 domain-containing protein [Bacillus cereus]